jgi:hypothetical protein
MLFFIKPTSARFPSEDQHHAARITPQAIHSPPSDAFAADADAQEERDHGVHERIAGRQRGARMAQQVQVRAEGDERAGTTRYSHAQARMRLRRPRGCSPSTRETSINAAPPHNISLAKPVAPGASGSASRRARSRATRPASPRHAGEASGEAPKLAPRTSSSTPATPTAMPASSSRPGRWPNSKPQQADQDRHDGDEGGDQAGADVLLRASRPVPCRRPASACRRPAALRHCAAVGQARRRRGRHDQAISRRRR